ncbi:hypothetical protein PUV54_07885 [Hyphococcus flavus]|uniref:DUF2975 domain-containing protein n=1 Tax=Hyphococcus flavus TaxID=1866326 RepID=A0AAF0CCC0_9PROT|nr:hypothetical protein [Hyphococcus flavus]WDI33115.1 hypothetical protein PUV54_07885 [Hyphococcus flavus]
MGRSKQWLRLTSIGFLIVIPFLAFLAVAGIAAYWGFGVDRWGNDFVGENFIVIAEHPPVPERRLFGLAAILAPLTFLLLGFWRLFQLFLTFHDGRLVASGTINHLKAFSVFSSLAVLTSFMFSGVMRWAMGVFDNAPLWTHLGFSTTHAAVLFTSAIVYAATHIIEEGYAYKQETKEYL